MTSASLRAHPKLILVTGPSGAGRSTALNALEDLSFETIDNIPLSLIPLLFDRGDTQGSVALGVDVRNRDFSFSGLKGIMAECARALGQAPELLYLDADTNALLRRYSETRRRHPLDPEGTPQEGILREKELLAEVRGFATRLIDTSGLSPHDLRADIHAAFAQEDAPKLAVSLKSFSYKRGMPRGADQVFDCRFLQNPHWNTELRPLTGVDQPVRDFVSADGRFDPFVEALEKLFLLQLPAMREEGKAHVVFAFGCTGGKHRSVAVTEVLGNALAAAGWQVSIRHRDLEARGITRGSITPERSGSR